MLYTALYYYVFRLFGIQCFPGLRLNALVRCFAAFICMFCIKHVFKDINNKVLHLQVLL